MRIVVIPVLCALFGSCASDEIPKEVLPINTMKVIVWDMAVADQVTINKHLYKSDSLKLMTTMNYQKVFAIHKIDKKKFYDSYTFYEGHPKYLKILYDSVTSYGNRAKTDTYKKIY